MTPRSTARTRRRRLSAELRDRETVKPLALFFDLVFVLGFTQCTALMVAEPTWAGIGRGMLVLAVLWWAWGVAAGALADDFAVMGLDMGDLGARFTAGIDARVGMLSGTDPDGLAEDPDKQLDVYRGYAEEGAQQHWQGDQLAGATDPTEVAATLADAAKRAGADALNLRVHVPGVPSDAAREQIVRIGDDVLGPLRKALA